MTKKEALADFKAHVLPFVISIYGKRDKPAKRQAWCNYTDILCKEGDITEKQNNTWTNPF